MWERRQEVSPRTTLSIGSGDIHSERLIDTAQARQPSGSSIEKVPN
jgi:hypothetical protein